MKLHNIIILTTIGLILSSCGNSTADQKDRFSLEIKNPQRAYSTADVITLSLVDKKEAKPDSVVYYLNKDRVEVLGNELPLLDKKLGERTLKAKIYVEGKEYEAAAKLTILSSIKPKLYTYKILESYPHDIRAYTQGLEFHNDTLYESSGQYKESSLRKVDYKTGNILKIVNLPDRYFGEGLTILNNKIYQLTWRENTGFIYNLQTMEQTGTFVYGESREGWGLAHDEENNIYKSDGTDKIWTLNSNTLAEKDYIEIMTNTSKIKSVNELEWVEGKIYANVYEQGSVAIINPKNGAVEGVIDLTDLKENVTQHPKLDVLNGIAYKGEPNILYITGKNWDKLFKIEILEKGK